jgi:hypothetical protein
VIGGGGAYHFCLRLVSKWAFRFYEYRKRVNLPIILFKIFLIALSKSASNGRQMHNRKFQCSECAIQSSVPSHLNFERLIRIIQSYLEYRFCGIHTSLPAKGVYVFRFLIGSEILYVFKFMVDSGMLTIHWNVECFSIIILKATHAFPKYIYL